MSDGQIYVNQSLPRGIRLRLLDGITGQAIDTKTIAGVAIVIRAPAGAETTLPAALDADYAVAPVAANVLNAPGSWKAWAMVRNADSSETPSTPVFFTVKLRGQK